MDEFCADSSFCLQLLCPLLNYMIKKYISLSLDSSYLPRIMILLELFQQSVTGCSLIMCEKDSRSNSASFVKSLLRYHKTIKKPKQERVNIYLENRED